MNNLLQYRSQKNYKKVLNLLTEALPDNLEIQTKLDSLITKKSSHIKKLLRKWIKRYLPIYSEKDIRELNLEFLSDKIRNIGDRFTRGYEAQCNLDSKSWILQPVKPVKPIKYLRYNLLPPTTMFGLYCIPQVYSQAKYLRQEAAN